MLPVSKKMAMAAISMLLVLDLGCSRSEPVLATPSIPTPTATPLPTPTATPLPTPTPTPLPTPTPISFESVLARSGQVMQGLRSFHFHFYHLKGGLELLPGLVIDEAQGDVVNPDQISVSFDGTFGTGFAIRASLITIGETSFMTNPLTGKWQSTDTAVSPLGFFNPARGITSMMSEVSQARQLAGNEGSDDTIRLAGNLSASSLSPLVGATLAEATVQVELTIDRKTSRLLRAEFFGRVTPTDTEGVRRVITLSDFNQETIIKPPR